MPVFRPGKPGWVLGQSTAQAIAAGGAVDLQWDVIDFEDPDVFDGVSSVTVDRDGLYLSLAHVTRASVATPSTVTVRQRVNGVTKYLTQHSTVQGAWTSECSGLLYLVEGDVLVINVTFHTTLASTTSAPSTRWTGSRIGPKRWT